MHAIFTIKKLVLLDTWRAQGASAPLLGRRPWPKASSVRRAVPSRKTRHLSPYAAFAAARNVCRCVLTPCPGPSQQQGRPQAYVQTTKGEPVPPWLTQCKQGGGEHLGCQLEAQTVQQGAFVLAAKCTKKITLQTQAHHSLPLPNGCILSSQVLVCTLPQAMRHR